MANFKRRRPRCRSHSRSRKDRERQADLKRRLPEISGWMWLHSWPQWWDLVFHRRPHRAKTKNTMRRVFSGHLDADDAAWPLHKAPHKYYW